MLTYNVVCAYVLQISVFFTFVASLPNLHSTGFSEDIKNWRTNFFPSRYSFQLVWSMLINWSVDALYRDGTDEISLDPCTKQLKILIHTFSRPHENSFIRDFTIFVSSLNPLSPYKYQLKRWFFHRTSLISLEVCTDIKQSFLAASHYGRSWSSSMVDTEQSHLLLTQHQWGTRKR